MTSQRPLAKTGSEVERLLLAAGANERPGEESVREAATALGLVPKVALVAATIGAARAVRWTSVATWFGVGVGSIGLASLVGTAVLVHGRTASRPQVVSPAAVHAPERTSEPEIVASAAGPAAVAPFASASMAPAPAAAASTLVSESSSAGHHDLAWPGLRSQADALDAARATLAAGDARRALARLDEFDRRFPHGPLREEALLLRIEALAHDGDRAAAMTLADRFLRAYPASVQANRVASILRQMREGAAP